MNPAEINVRVSDYHGNFVTVTLWQLLQWRSALRLEAAGLKHSKGSVTAHVRTVLSCPVKGWGAGELADYLSEVIDDTHTQLEGAA